MAQSTNTKKERIRLAVLLEELLCDWTVKAVHGSPIIPMEEIKDLQLIIAIASLDEHDRLFFSSGLKRSKTACPNISVKLFAMRNMALMDDFMAMPDYELINALNEKIAQSRAELIQFLANNPR